MNPPLLPPPLPTPRKSPVSAILRLLLLIVVGCLVVGYLNFDLLRQSAEKIFHSYAPASIRASIPDHANRGTDAIMQELMAYRYSTRMAYNARRFDELERLADDARSSKAKFGNGSWQIHQFYDSLLCADTEPASMCQLHDQIHQAWIAAKPQSATAQVAYLKFLVDYAWQARGSGFAGTVTSDGWRIFGERLKTAHEVMDNSKSFASICPEWWSGCLGLALGEGWPRTDFDACYHQAKTSEPTFYNYDTLRSNFLATKWYGKPGDWEAAAAEAASDPAGLGPEVYTRCVLTQFGNYGNVFKESGATWAKTREGFELMRQRYPNSLEVASSYCRLACIAGDRPTAKRLFDLLGDNAFSYLWLNLENLRRDRAWANVSN